MCGHLSRNQRTVVGDVDDHGLLLAGVGTYPDVAGVGADGLHGILQQVGQDVADESLVGIDQQVARLDVHLNGDAAGRRLLQGYLAHTLGEGLHVERTGMRSRDVGQLAVGVDKREQVAAGAVDDLQPGPGLGIVGSAEQGLAQAGDGRHGVHDLVGEHADELVPRLLLAVVQFAANVVDGNDAHLVVVQPDRRRPQL